MEITLQYPFNYEAKIMESIGYFFRRIFDRLSDRIRYKVTDAAESKFRETVEKPFERKAKNH